MKPNRMSLNPIWSIIKYNELIDQFKKDAKKARQMFGVKLTFKAWIKHNRISIDYEVQKPLNVLEYYQKVKDNATGKHMNYKS